MAKIGINERDKEPARIGVSFVIIDNKPHLTHKGIEYLAKWVKRLFLVTSNPHHPAFTLKAKYPNIEVIYYLDEINLVDLLNKLKNRYGVERLTIQSGGTLNSAWLRASLIDTISVVIAPCLIGGSNTQNLIGGESLHNQIDLLKIKALKLIKCNVLENSYIHIQYEVINNTVVE
jgi:2,5-diamino-6-(ribosylamino)-4(3H)-pyrimidinone 5'-phosphate reductase